jgi:hypothetical protein
LIYLELVSAVNQFASMSHHAKINIPRVVSAPAEQLMVVQPPSDLTKQETNTVIACLVSVLKTSPPDYLTIVELAYNIMQLALPGLRALAPDMAALQVRVVSPTRAQILAWVGLGDGAGPEETGPLSSLYGKVVDEAKAITGTIPVYAAVASVLMAMGRQASESQAASTLDKRPDALIRRFSIPEEDRVLLPGRAAGPSRESLECLYNAMSVYTVVRAEITRFLIGAKRSMAHFPLEWEVIMTNFHLMRGAGMTHVDAILKLAKMQPWTLKVPQLEPYWAKFVEDLTQFNEVEEDVRPYHRLLVPQTSFLFLSPNLAPLVAVAGHFLKEVETSFANHVYRAADYADLLDTVDRYAPGYIPTHQTNNLAALLGVADVPLPHKPREKEEGEDEEVVV